MRTVSTSPSSVSATRLPRSLSRATGFLFLALLVGGTLAAALGAQDPRGWMRTPEGWAGGRHQREMVPSERKGFYGCKLMFDRVRFEPAGRGWDTDYPMGIRNLMLRLSELTSTPINRYPDGAMADGVVRGSDSGLFKCPFLMAADVGTAGFSPAEIEGLREYFLKGGFLWADDFWGEAAMRHWLGQLERILPGYTAITLDEHHPLMATFHSLREVRQMPNIGFWRRSGGQTSERGAESATPTITAIADEKGRVMVVMTHNTDIGDGMERDGEDYEYFHHFSPHAYSMAINIAIYAMTR